MSSVFGVTIPLFLLIFAGYVARGLNLLTGDQIRGLSRFVLTFALPCLFFLALAHQSPRVLANWNYLGVYAGASATLLGLALLWFGLVRRVGSSASAIRAMGSSVSNSAFIGFPVATAVLGPHAGVPFALTMIVETMLMLPIVTAIAESGAAKRVGPWAVVRTVVTGLIRSPLIWSVFLGFVFALLAIPVPEIVERPLDLMGKASAPVALFSIGGSLYGIRIGSMRADIAQIAFAKLLLHPTLVIVFLSVIPVADPLMHRAAILFSSVPMVTLFAMLGAKYGDEEVSAATLLVTTAVSFFTLSAMIYLFVMPPV